MADNIAARMDRYVQIWVLYCTLRVQFCDFSIFVKLMEDREMSKRQEKLKKE